MKFPLRRHWFQFRLQRLLIFATLCAMAFGAAAYEYEQMQREQAAIDSIRANYGYVFGLADQSRFSRWLDRWLRPYLRVDIDGADATTDLSMLVDLGRMHSLELNYLENYDRVPFEKLTKLEYLVVQNATPRDVARVGQMTNLRSLVIECLDFDQQLDLRVLDKLQNLESLEINGGKFSDLAPLTKFSKLKDLALSNSNVSELGPLANLAKLESLSLPQTEVRELAPLRRLTRLRLLILSNTNITDISPLADLVNLQMLSVDNTSIADLSALTRLDDLESLDLSQTQITDLNPVSHLQRLITLDISNSPVSDLSPLFELKALSFVDASNTDVSEQTASGFRRSLPTCSLWCRFTTLLDEI